METAVTYEQLLITYGNYKSVPYDELLRTVEWKAKRAKIISRDGHMCCHCKMTETIYENRPPYHFCLDGEDEYEIIYNDDGIPIKERWKIRLVPAQRCVVFHVHHTYYYFDTCPWDYPDESLITLCSNCHFDAHQSSLIKWFDKNNNFTYLTPCPRCSGVGRLPQYSHVQNGVCFYCKGSMYLELMK